MDKTGRQGKLTPLDNPHLDSSVWVLTGKMVDFSEAIERKLNLGYLFLLGCSRRRWTMGSDICSPTPSQENC